MAAPALPKVLDARGQPMAPQMSEAYGGASRRDPDLLSWAPVLRSPDAEILPSWEPMVSRTRDITRNHGFAAGAVQTHVDTVIGSGLRLMAKPDYRALGLSVEWAQEWEREVQARWRLWAEDVDFKCDAGRQLNFSGLLAQAYRSYLLSTEILAVLEWMPVGGGYGTTVNMVQPDRLSNPLDAPDTYYLRRGVEVNNFGAPQAFHIRDAHPSDAQWHQAPVMRWKRVPTYRTRRGRRNVIHIYDPEQPGQTRGKTPFASVLAKLRTLDRWEKASLQAAIINAMYAATIKSSFDGIQDAMGETQGSPYNTLVAMQSAYAGDKERAIHFDGAKIAHLLPGEELDLKSAKHPTSEFEQFERATLRQIAAGLNMSYEQLSRDYSQTSYASARAAMLEGWRFFSGRRHHIASSFATQIYVAWLEEAIDRGDVTLPKGAPDFYTAKTAWTKCRWIGSPRGHIDELKEIQARREKYEMGITTLEDLCAEDGTDWEEVQEQRARERHRIRKLGEDPDSYLRRSGLSPAKQAEHDARVDESRRQDREAAQRHTEATLAAVGRIGEQMANGSAQLAAAVAHLPPPQVTVGETHVTVPERSVTVEPQINVAAPEVTVHPPDVHVTAPEVRVDVAAPNVNVQAPKPDPAEAEAYQRISDKLAGKKTTARKSGKRKP